MPTLKVKRLIQSFSTAAIGACLFGVAAVNEISGYNALEFSGWNIGCAIDPTCRKLTNTEIEFARVYFGDTVNYSSINYFERAPIWTLRRQYNKFIGSDTILATHAFGNIYEGNSSLYDHETGSIKNPTTFGHEMMHVWQYQNLSLVTLGRISSNKTRHYTIDRADDNVRFLSYYYEQQSEILENVIRLRIRLESLTENGSSIPQKLCDDLSEHETLVAQILPITITQCYSHPVS